MGTLSNAGGKEFAATNRPGTCLWCGDRLVRREVMVDDSRRGEPGVTWHELGHYATELAETPGPYHDGFFCSLRCGFQFGVRMAGFDHRLQPRRA